MKDQRRSTEQNDGSGFLCQRFLIYMYIVVERGGIATKLLCFIFFFYTVLNVFKFFLLGIKIKRAQRGSNRLRVRFLPRSLNSGLNGRGYLVTN